jgi:hypothetical protein
MEEGLAAIDAAIAAGRPTLPSVHPVRIATATDGEPAMLDEVRSKQALAGFGLSLPRSATGATVANIAEEISVLRYPVALKALGFAHKSEAGAVALGLTSPAQVLAAAQRMPVGGNGFLVEEMVAGGVAEILVGITRDVTGLLVLTVGAGGVLAELLGDTASLLLPAERHEIDEALRSLRVDRVVAGWRGKPAADRAKLIDAILAICAYALAHAEVLEELDVNPLIACSDGAIAVDALIRLRKEA